MRTIAVYNNKGGVGKTTSVISLASVLCTQKKKCLIVDMDAQGCLSNYLSSDQETQYYLDHENWNSLENILESHLNPNITSVITSFRYYDRKTKSYPELMLDVIYCTPKLALHEFTSPWEVKNMLAEMEESEYDYCFLDLPPAVSDSTYVGLFASDYVLTPCKADKFSAHAIANVEEILADVRQTKPDLSFLGAFITDFDTRYTISNKLKDAYVGNDAIFFKSFVRHSSCFDLAALEGKPIVCYSSTTGAADYRKVAAEMLERM